MVIPANSVPLLRPNLRLRVRRRRTLLRRRRMGSNVSVLDTADALRVFHRLGGHVREACGLDLDVLLVAGLRVGLGELQGGQHGAHGTRRQNGIGIVRSTRTIHRIRRVLLSHI